MTRIVCVGISVFDYVFRVERLPETHVKHYARGRAEVMGGIAANAARAVARLGAEAALLSRVGDDLPGRAIRAELEAEGIDARGVHRLRGVRTSLSAVIVDPAGERMLINDADPAILDGVEGVSIHVFEGASAILADTRWADAARLAVRAARELTIPAVLDFEGMPGLGGCRELLDLASHVVFSRQGLLELTGCTDPATGLRQAREQSPAFLAVTSGAEGVYWLDGGEVRRVPGFAVESIDTLGAGDVFHAAFTLALVEGQPVEAAMRFANAAAALKCTRFGGGSGAPRRAEVDAFLAERA